ncbi:MAG: ribonuclease Z [Bacteroidales bacterium]|nr:ribonuclease Z [Bacteroidales bacterium]
MMSFSLTILGSSSALPTKDRFSTAQVLNILERFFLIDCGEGTQIQLRKFNIKFAKINNIFISHLHGDHYFGLNGLISTFNLLGRKNDLNIYAPIQLEQLIKCQSKILDNELEFNINFHKITPKRSEIIFEDDKLTVKTIPLKHRIPTCGFLFKEKPRQKNIRKDMVEFLKIPIKEIIKIKDGADYISNDGKLYTNDVLTIPPPKPRSYAYCSDTLYSEKIIPVIKDVDLLYHEATFAERHKSKAKESFHSTSVQAATIALKANVKKLIIGHFSPRYKDLSPLLNEAKSVFKNTELAEDGNTFKVES